jgi:hypothetical protein
VFRVHAAEKLGLAKHLRAEIIDILGIPESGAAEIEKCQVASQQRRYQQRKRGYNRAPPPANSASSARLPTRANSAIRLISSGFSPPFGKPFDHDSTNLQDPQDFMQNRNLLCAQSFVR